MKRTLTKHSNWWRKLLSVSTMLALAPTLQAQAYLNQDFSTATGTTPPAGWTNMAGPSTSELWSSDNPGSQPLNTDGFSGKFFIIDSDFLGSGSTQDSRLTTPLLNLTSSINPYLQFSEHFRSGYGSKGYIAYSIDSGNTWTNLAIRDSFDVGYPTPVRTIIPVPAVAGHSGVKFRWTYTGNYAWWWAIDAISVAEFGNTIIQTENATAITTTQATIKSTLLADGGTTITRSGILFSTTPAPELGNIGVTDTVSSPTITNGTFSIELTGLTLATTYHYRGYAVNATDTIYGGDSSFTTNATAIAPSITAIAASNIEATIATMGGSIVSDGGDSIISSGIVVGTTPNPTIGSPGVIDSLTNPSVSTGNFSISVTSLTHSTRYYFRAYATNAVGTSYSNTDSFTTAYAITTLPYLESFDSSATPWTSASVNGGTNAWQRGTPTKTVISAAYSAPNAFVTQLAGPYPEPSECAVVSPQIDLSAYSIDPVLRFKHQFDEFDQGTDGGVVQISINGGPWTTLDNMTGSAPDFNTPNSTNWYNNNSGWSWLGANNTFSGSSSSYPSHVNGWISSTTPLIGTAGQSDVRVRFYFGSDYHNSSDGWAIDNIEIVQPTGATVLTVQANYITNVSATLKGNIIDNGLSTVTASGIVFATSSNPTIGDIGVIDSASNPSVSLGMFSINVSGLAPSTLYHYRSYAINAIDTAYGADSMFTTAAVASTPILNATLNNNAETTVTLGGAILTNGGDPITTSGIVYSNLPNPIIGGPGVIDTITNPLVASGSFNLDLSGLNPKTKYFYKAYAINAIGIAYSSVDSFITKPIYDSFPYSENFEGVTASDWYSTAASGAPNEWVLGTPAKTFISGAHSGSKAWVTKLSGNYSHNTDGAVVSPRFDFSNQTADPILTFSNKFLTGEPGADNLVVEMSINNGPYVVIDDNQGSGTNFNTTTNESFGWYNEPNYGVTSLASIWGFSGSSAGYSSQSNGWIESSAILSGAAGESNVRIRIHFASTYLTFLPTGEGVAFDDITITEAMAPTIATNAASNLTLNTVTLGGTITNNGRSLVTASGIALGTSPNPSIGDFGVIDTATSPHVSMGSYSIDMNGLLPSTTYFYRAYAINAVDTSYGGDSSFVTPAMAMLASINTNAYSNIGTTMITLHATINHNGGAPVTTSGVVVGLSPNPSIGDPGVVDSTSNPMVSMGAYSIDFTGLAHSTNYYYRAYAINAVGVGYSNLDSFTTAPIITSLPYTENFDSATTMWTAVSTGGTNSWVRGTPGKTFLNGAFSAPNAFVTTLTGNYAGTENCAILSPQFDFTANINNPVLRFMHKFKTDNDPNYDGVVVEMSINGGTWTRLNSSTGIGTNFNTPTSYAWYNNASGAGSLGPNKFNGLSSNYASADSNGWIECATILTGAAGQSDVRIRFRFWADSGVDEGNAIDNIEIVEINAPTVQASTVNLTGIGNTNTTVNWTNGNGQGRVVVARLTTTPAVTPSNNVLYTPSPAFGSGDSTGLGNKIVFKGTASLVSVTNLDELTDYTYDVYEYNGKYMHIQFTAAASNNGSTLPVTLTNFNAIANAKDALLNWTTTSESNNSGFEIERSTDGRLFESVNFVKGAGNSNRKLNYAYTDVAAFTKAGVWYYRLKQVDVDGKYTYSHIVKVSVNSKQISSISVYPNPFKSDYTVSFHATKQGVVQLELMDMQGRVIATTQLNATEGANIIPVTETATLQKGMYFLKLTINAESQTLKLVKE